MSKRSLRIMLDARLIPGQSGGVEQIVLGLMHAFARFGDKHQYYFLTYNGAESWLGRYASKNVQLVEAGPAPVAGPMLKRKLGPFVPLAKWLRRLVVPLKAEIGDEPPVVTKIDPDIIHFNIQTAFRTNRRNIYQPWDLQHVHYPNFFNRDDWIKRDFRYRYFCSQAHKILMTSQWGRQDVADSYGINAERIHVVSMASPAVVYPEANDDELGALLKHKGIIDPFIFFPGQTWPHKNHKQLIEAIIRARNKDGIVINLVCTGKLTEHHAVLARQAQSAGIAEQIKFLGFTDEKTILALYRGARFLVFPSLFEGWGLPVTEAMQLGVPVVAARATCLPEQIGDAGLLFDPNDPDDIARVLVEVWNNESIRSDLIARGKERESQYTWERTASELIALYEELAYS